MNKIVTAVIGAGYWGTNHIRIFGEKSELKYIVDVDKSKLLPYTNKVKCTDDISHVLSDEAVKAVIISTPPDSHYDLIYKCLKANKHVLCEKPLVTKYIQTEWLKNIKKDNQVLMTDHTFLFTPEIQFIKKFISTGELGQLFCISTSRGNLGRFQKCNVLTDLAPHDISIFNYLIDRKPVRLFAFGRDYIQPDIEDIAYLTIDYITRTMATARFSWIDPRRTRETIIVGSEKMIIYTMGVEESIKIYDKGVSKTYYEEIKDFSNYLLSYRHGNITSPRLETWEPLQRVAEEFLNRCIKNEDPPDSISGINFSAGVVQLLEEANFSLLQNRLNQQSLGWRKIYCDCYR